MKRLSLVALLLAGSVAAAHADNDIYTNMSKTEARRRRAAWRRRSVRCRVRRAAERHADVAAIQELHARPRLALQPRHPRAAPARRRLSRPRQWRPRLPRFHDRRHHRIELHKFLRCLRHCERSEAIHCSACGCMDCFVVVAPRNDVDRVGRRAFENAKRPARAAAGR